MFTGPARLKQRVYSVGIVRWMLPCGLHREFLRSLLRSGFCSAAVTARTTGNELPGFTTYRLAVMLF